MCIMNRFRPETLTCTPGQDPSTCLTGSQVVAVRHVYADYFEANQRYIFGTYYPGGELQFATGGYLGSAPDQLAITYYENFVLKYVASLRSIRGAISFKRMSSQLHWIYYSRL